MTLHSSTRDPAICNGDRCPRLMPMGMAYCTRCVVRLKHESAPGLTDREIEGALDRLSRQRALTEPESVLLEYAIKVNAAADRYNARRNAA